MYIFSPSNLYPCTVWSTNSSNAINEEKEEMDDSEDAVFDASTTPSTGRRMHPFSIAGFFIHIKYDDDIDTVESHYNGSMSNICFEVP